MSSMKNNNNTIIIDSQNPNAIGKVVDKDTNKELSEITPLIMILNASTKTRTNQKSKSNIKNKD